jgi:hypothetical protein
MLDHRVVMSKMEVRLVLLYTGAGTLEPSVRLRAYDRYRHDPPAALSTRKGWVEA